MLSRTPFADDNVARRALARPHDSGVEASHILVHGVCARSVEDWVIARQHNGGSVEMPACRVVQARLVHVFGLLLRLGEQRISRCETPLLHACEECVRVARAPFPLPSPTGSLSLCLSGVPRPV